MRLATFYYDYICLFVFFTKVYYNYYPVAFEKYYGLCFQEKYMNESFDMDEYCSELHRGKKDERIAKSSALNAILKELLDEKISTQRKDHWILGPEDLNDTLVYDFEIEEAA